MKLNPGRQPCETLLAPLVGAVLLIGALVPSAKAIDLTASPFPFLGNSTVLGYNPGARQLLLRQPDCSMMLDSYLHFTVTGTADFQNTLRAWSDLPVITPTYPLGCKDTSLGVASNFEYAYLGQDGAGNYYAAEANDNLLIGKAMPDSFTTKLSELAQNVGAEVLSVDLNNDGHLDLIVSGVTDPTSHAVGLGVYISNGDGTFKAPVVYPFNLGAVSPFMMEDLNGDGIPDLVVFNYTAAVGQGGSTPQISTLLGRSDGSFTTGSTIGLPADGGTLAGGDFNGDHKNDVIVGSHLLIGKGDGSFTVASGTLPFFGFAVAPGDFNRDGKLDVAVYGELGNSITIYLGNGDGTFTAGASYEASPLALQALYATDIDGDGKLDLVSGTVSNGLYAPSIGLVLGALQVLFGKGDGSFVGAPLTPTAAANSAAHVLATAEFTSSGHVDAVLPGTGSNSVIVLPGTGTGTFGTAIPTSTNFPVQSGATADLNGDGKPDLVVAGGTNLGVLFGTGSGTFQNEADYTLAGGVAGDNYPFVSPIAIADFNGDGKLDVAVAISGGGVYVLFGQGGGVLGTPVQVDTSANPILAAGNLNGDGRTDLVVVDGGTYNGGTIVSTAVMHIYLANANGTFTASTTPVPAITISDMRLVDLNGDGKLDIVAGGTDANTITQVISLLGHGDGTFATAVQTYLSGGVADPTPGLAVGDFNGDGKQDVAFALPDTFTGILLGAGDGSFSAQANLGIGDGEGLTVADLNGDGKPDLLVSSAPSGGIVSLVNLTGQVTINILPGFTSALSPGLATVAAGQSSTTTLSVSAGGGGYSGSVSFSCAGLPTGASCSFSPTSVAVGSSTTLKISTTARSASAVLAPGAGPLNPWVPSGLLLAGLLTPWVIRRRFNTPGRPLMRVAGLTIAAIAVSSCGGGSSNTSSGVSSSASSSSGSSSGGASGGTPSGVYTIPITVTGGATTQTVVYTLTVD